MSTQTLLQNLSAAVEAARQTVTDSAERAMVSRLLKGLQRAVADKVREKITVWSTPLPITDVMRGHVPATLLHRALAGQLCVIKIKSSRDLWYLARHSCAGQSVTSIRCAEGSTLYLWDTKDTNEKELEKYGC